MPKLYIVYLYKKRFDQFPYKKIFVGKKHFQNEDLGFAMFGGGSLGAVRGRIRQDPAGQALPRGQHLRELP